MRLNKRTLFAIGLAVIVAVAFIGTSSMAQEKQVIKVTAKKFEYSPNEIKVKKGVPVVLEFTSLDRLHGFDCPGLGIRTDIEPGKVNRLEFTPEKAGTFPFHCDNFCGVGHDKMTGKIVVEE
jgi:cytochrome c oxidase subunit II